MSVGNRLVVIFRTEEPPDSALLSSGMNGYMTPFIESAPPARNPSFPVTWVQLTLDQIDKLFYRTRLLSVDTDATATAGGTVTTIPSGELDGGTIKQLFPLTRFDDERDYTMVPTTFAPSFMASTPGNTFTIQMFVDAINPAPVIYKETVSPEEIKYWIPVLISGTITASDAPDGAGLQFSSDAAGLVDPDGTVDADIAGLFTVPLAWEETIFEAGTTNFTYLTVGVLKSWPYAYKDGSPVFDEDTGDQIDSGRDVAE